MKTASRILGSAFFADGFEVQDAPRYGAERRGAPIFAYVRAARTPIQERGVIRNPDLVIVADDTLLQEPSAGVLTGLEPHTVVLILTAEKADTWREQLGDSVRVVRVESGSETGGLVGATCAGAAARLVGEIPRDALALGLRAELTGLGSAALERSLSLAFSAWEAVEADAGCVREGPGPPAGVGVAPEWVDLPLETADISAPDVYAGLTSVQVRTGLWRTTRPVVDEGRCTRCSWICSNFCPDGAIAIDAERRPQIDYDHCKGCLICVAVCPPHAIEAVPEVSATRQSEEQRP